MTLFIVVIFFIHLLNNQVQSTVNYCIYCNGCSTPNNGILASLDEETCDVSSGANDLCYVGIKTSDNQYYQGCAAANADFSAFASITTCTSDRCNRIGMTCYSCAGCAAQSTSKLDLCINQVLCYVGVKSDGKFDQGCYDINMNTNSYSTISYCGTDNCNTFNGVTCYYCYRCKTPQSSVKTSCTGTETQCYVGLTSDGLYLHDCKTPGKSVIGAVDTQECTGNDCNIGSLSCLYCSSCATLNAKSSRKLCISPNDKLCYYGYNKDGTIVDQGCGPSNMDLSKYASSKSCTTNQCNVLPPLSSSSGQFHYHYSSFSIIFHLGVLIFIHF